MSIPPQVITDQDGVICLKNYNGDIIHFSSPWSSTHNPISIYHLLPGNCMYFGASRGLSDGVIRLYFLPLSSGQASRYISWNVSLSSGSYIDQDIFDLDIREPNFIGSELIHKIQGVSFARQAVKFLNDLVIYQFIKYVLCDANGATGYINKYSPINTVGEKEISIEHGKLSVHLLVLYNHNYSRNIPTLDRLYTNRFTSVYHVLPNVCPRHSRCMSAPAGSYQYHYLIYHALANLEMKFKSSPSQDWILIVQDDVMLHPSLNENSFSESIIDKSSAVAYYHDLSVNHNPSDKWFWNERVANSCLKQGDPVYGNGFEGMNGFYNAEFLSRGVSDIFAIRLGHLRDFIEALGFFMSQNIFPEVSIPSALKRVCTSSGKNVHVMPGIYLWREDRKQVGSTKWLIDNFINTKNVFLHPVKVSIQTQDLTDLPIDENSTD